MEWSAVRICVLQCKWRSREILVSTLERIFVSCETWIYWMKVAAALASFLAFSKDFSFWMVLALNFLKGMNNIDGKGTWKNRKLKFKLYRWREKQRNAQIEKKDSLRKRERERVCSQQKRNESFEMVFRLNRRERERKCKSRPRLSHHRIVTWTRYLRWENIAREFANCLWHIGWPVWST